MITHTQAASQQSWHGWRTRVSRRCARHPLPALPRVCPWARALVPRSCACVAVGHGQAMDKSPSAEEQLLPLLIGWCLCVHSPCVLHCLNTICVCACVLRYLTTICIYLCVLRCLTTVVVVCVWCCLTTGCIYVCVVVLSHHYSCSCVLLQSGRKRHGGFRCRHCRCPVHEHECHRAAAWYVRKRVCYASFNVCAV